MVDVKGYSPLTDEQKALANEGKELEERCLRWLDKVEDSHLHGPETPIGADNPIPMAVLGRRSIQVGFMWAVRSIFRPQRIGLPEDMVEGRLYPRDNPPDRIAG